MKRFDLVNKISKCILCKNTVRLQHSAKRIIGIDPGTLMMGYGIIEISGTKIRLLEMQVLKLSGKKSNHERLLTIYNKVSELIELYQPEEFAIEAPFFGKNVQSMLKLGRAQGVAIAAAMQAGLQVTEYPPKKVKQSVTGNGSANKLQVWKMLSHYLNITEAPKYFDATDALAIAVCHHFSLSSPLKSVGKNFSDWNEFILKNPDKIARRR